MQISVKPFSIQYSSNQPLKMGVSGGPKFHEDTSPERIRDGYNELQRKLDDEALKERDPEGKFTYSPRVPDLQLSEGDTVEIVTNSGKTVTQGF